jgi:hypothetical protein
LLYSTCVDESDPNSLQVIRLDIIDVRSKKPDYLPLGVPSDLAPLLDEFHGDPYVWWAGQILNYIMRFNDKFQKIVDETTRKIGFKTPCVGFVFQLILKIKMIRQLYPERGSKNPNQKQDPEVLKPTQKYQKSQIFEIFGFGISEDF